MKTTLKVEGFKELDEALGTLKKSIAKGVARRALLRAAQPIIDEARRRAPKRTGRLERSITASTRTKNRAGAAAFRQVLKSGGSYGAAVQAMKDARSSETANAAWQVMNIGPSTDAPHGHLQEFGSVNNPPQPFMRPAFDDKWREALDLIATTLRDEINKAIDRATRRAERMRQGMRL